MTKTLSPELLAEIVDYNRHLYHQGWNEYLAAIKGNKVLVNLSQEGFVSQPSFEVQEYFYQEYLTTYTGSSFYNTLAYIKACCDSKTFDDLKIGLTSLNSQFQYIISNGFMILEASEENLEDISEFEQTLVESQVELYQEFLTAIKKELGSKILPSILKTYLNVTTSNQELLLKKYSLQVEKSFKIINAKVQQKTQLLLEKIYHQCGLKPYSEQKQAKHLKGRFDDFSNDQVLFKIDFDDQKIALETLGLSIDATMGEVKHAYKQLASKYHPDNNKSKSAELEMKRINIAYNLLKQTLSKN